MKNLKELREKSGELVVKMQGITAAATTEKRGMTAEEANQFNGFYDEKIEVDKKIKAEERAEEIRAAAAKEAEILRSEIGGSAAENHEKLNRAFKNLMLKRATSEDLALITKIEKRATEQSTTAAEGGYTIPTGFLAELSSTQLYYGPMLDPTLCKILDTPSGNDLHIPTNDDTAVKATKIAEGAAVGSGTSPVWAEKVLKAFKYSTGIVKYTPELLQDSAFDFASVLGLLFGERMGRGLNYSFTNGVGTTDVEGVVVGASAGITTAAAAAITEDELLDLLYSLDASYRTNGTFMMNDSTLKAIITLAVGTASTQANLYQPGFALNDNGMILNHKIIINNDMDSIAATKIPIIFGDFKQYTQRYIGAPTFKTLFELYAATDELAAIMFRRVDGQVMQTTAFKKLTCHV